MGDKVGRISLRDRPPSIIDFLCLQHSSRPQRRLFGSVDDSNWNFQSRAIAGEKGAWAFRACHPAIPSLQTCHRPRSPGLESRWFLPIVYYSAVVLVGPCRYSGVQV